VIDLLKRLLSEGTEGLIRLTNAFTRFTKAAGLRSAGGRVMLACELVAGVLLAFVIAIFLTHEVVAAVVSWLISSKSIGFRETREMFLTYAGIIVLSMFFVFIREALGPQTRVPRRPRR
jgi:hypothetical protein